MMVSFLYAKIAQQKYTKGKLINSVNPPPPLNLRFVLDTLEVRAYGEIIWSRTFGKGKQYGVNFNHQEAVED